MSQFRFAVIALALGGCVDPGAETSGELAGGGSVALRSELGRCDAELSLVGDSLVRGENAFRLELHPGDVRVDSASAFMPAHGHGTKPGELRLVDGAWQIDLSLYMRGRWDVAVELRLADDGADALRFAVDAP